MELSYLVPQKIKKRILSQDTRSKNVLKNVTFSFIFKGINILIQLALIPLTIDYLNKEKYGIWLTLSAIIGWFSFFDIGLGNGLRNKLAEAIANNDRILARTLISTTYAILLLIFGTAVILFAIINPFINWTKVLNTSGELKSELSWVALIAFTFFCLRFIFSLISNILFAVQKAALNNFIIALGNIFSIILIYILQFFIKGSLFAVGVVLSSVPVLILILTSIILFTSKLRDLRPALVYVNLEKSRGLMGLGYKFFIIQIAGIVLFSCSELMITQLYGPGEVTAYNIAYRYFMVLTMLNGILMTPLWSAFTDAYAKKDFLWIRQTIKKLNLISILLCFIACIMILFSDKIYSFWIGNFIIIPRYLSITLGLFVCFSVIVAPYNSFINGVGKIKLQYYSAIFSTVITIPLALFFAKYFNMGPECVVVATLCTTIPCTILWFIQYKKIITNSAKGIWNA